MEGLHPGLVGQAVWQSNPEHLSEEDREALRSAVEFVANKNSNQYSSTLAENPILAWLETEDPSSRELADALSEMEERVAQLAEELKEEEPSDKLLFSFQALTEDLLKETAEEGQASPYCLVVEKARLKAEGGISIGAIVGMGALMTPCFFAAPILAAACLAAGLGYTAYDLQESDSHVQRSLGHLVLSGKSLERLGELAPQAL